MPKHKHKSSKRGQRSSSPDETLENETPSTDENPPGNDEDQEGVEPIDESDGIDSDVDEVLESIEKMHRRDKAEDSQLRDVLDNESAAESGRTEEGLDTRGEALVVKEEALATRAKSWKVGRFGQWSGGVARAADVNQTNDNSAGSVRANEDRDWAPRPRPTSKFKFKRVHSNGHHRQIFNAQASPTNQAKKRTDHEQEENDHNMTVVIDESDDQDEECENDPSKPGPSHMKPKKRKLFTPQTQATSSSEATGESSWHTAQSRQPHEQSSEQADETVETAASRDRPMYVLNEEAGTSQIYQQRRKRKTFEPLQVPTVLPPALKSLPYSEYKRATEEFIQNNERAMDEDVEDRERERTREEDVINRDLERSTAEIEQSTRNLERREAEQSKRQAEQSRREEDSSSRSLINQTITEAQQSMIERRRTVLKLASKKKEQLTRKNDVIKKLINEASDSGSQNKHQTKASASKPRNVRSNEPKSPEPPPPGTHADAAGADEGREDEQASPRSPSPEAAEGNAGDEASEENAATGDDDDVVAGLREELNAITSKYTSLVTMLQAKVECPVCLEVPKRAPIPVCPNGHAICTTCVRTTCPTCRVRMGDGTSLIAVTIIENIPHTCDFQINGCQVVCELGDLQLHLKVCPFRTVKCPNFSCNMRVPLSELAEHTLTRCIHTGTYKSSPLVTNYNYVISENHQDGLFDLRRNSTWRPDGIAFDEKNFYLKIMRKARKSLWYFFIQMAGTEEECDQYVATLHVFKPANKVGGKFSNRFVTGVCPIDISSTERAAATGYCSLLPDGIMKQMLKEVAPRVNGNKKFEFSVSVYLQRREDFEKDMENESQPGPSTSRNSEQDTDKDKEIKAYQQKLKELDNKIKEQDDLIKALRRSEDFESNGEGQNEEQPEESSSPSEARSGAESPDSMLGNLHEGRESDNDNDNDTDVWM